MQQFFLLSWIFMAAAVIVAPIVGFIQSRRAIWVLAGFATFNSCAYAMVVFQIDEGQDAAMGLMVAIIGWMGVAFLGAFGFLARTSWNLRTKKSDPR
jgi:hypothetical protein